MNAAGVFTAEQSRPPPATAVVASIMLIGSTWSWRSAVAAASAAAAAADVAAALALSCRVGPSGVPDRQLAGSLMGLLTP